MERNYVIFKQLEKIMNVNRDISDHFEGSIRQLFEYGKKHNIMIPQKESLAQILYNLQFLCKEESRMIDEFNNTTRYINQNPTKTIMTKHPKMLEPIKSTLLN
ncbi:MAG: hypothetical protein R1F52_05120 [Candidatus Nitrosoabyssus spongiisocia]|nr:MAG: hypothetical protein R1F52_05120 [Nitrosopumilaceae archaeon AB1(1)]